MPQLQPWASAVRSKIEDKVPSVVGGNDVIEVPNVVGGNIVDYGIINGMKANPWPWQVSIQVVLQVLKT